jgi:NAD-dependent SIR2 family protein deacetylase
MRLEGEVKSLYCHECGKQVSTGFIPVPTDTPDHGLIVRAWIECPECIEKRAGEVKPDETVVEEVKPVRPRSEWRRALKEKYEELPDRDER